MEMMRIETSTGIPKYVVPELTTEQIGIEFKYLQAEKIVNDLLKKGLITEEEFQKIMDKCRQLFPTYLSPLY